jgi:excisionase family DNA binding protein
MDLLTVRETASMLKVNPMTVRRYIRSGRLPAVRVGRQIRIQKDDAEALTTPIAPAANSSLSGRYAFHPPSVAEISRRRALLETILARREQRRITPLTSADLVHFAREQNDRTGAGH